MKKIRFLALVLAVVIMCISIPSCAEVVTVKNVRFSAIIEIPTGEFDEDGNPIFSEEVLVDTLQADITGTSKEYPTVLDAVEQILSLNGIKYVAEEESIASIKGKKEGRRGGYSYVWEYNVKAQDANNPNMYYDANKDQSGKDLRAHQILLSDNMKIVYTLKGEYINKDQSSDSTSGN